MTGNALLAALPCAALALALSKASWRRALPALAVCLSAAILSNLFLASLAPFKLLVLGAALTTAVTLAPVYLRSPLRAIMLAVLAANAGVWSGALSATVRGPVGLALVLPWLALWAPAAWLVQRRWEIVLKIAASWLIAIAVLAVALNSVSMPSYQLDHME